MTGDGYKRAIGLFPNRQEAEYALTLLHNAKFAMSRVSVIAKDAIANNGSGNVNEDTTYGFVDGTENAKITSSLRRLNSGLRLLTIPEDETNTELGLVLGSLVFGSSHLINALVAWGIPETEAQYYNERVTKGDYLVIIEETAYEIRRSENIFDNLRLRHWRIYDAPIPISRLAEKVI